MKFEEALVHLRAGKKIRNEHWHNESFLGGLLKSEILYGNWIVIDEPEKYYQDGIELPTIHNEQTIEKRLSDLEFRLKEVERFQDITHEQYMSISRKEKPHVCPICEGCGNDKGTIESNPNFDFHKKYASCHACDGKGVIWK